MLMSTRIDIKAWAEAYIRVNEDHAITDESHPDYLAAYEFMDELIGQLAEDCWLGILEVVKLKPSDWVLGMLAAGPVEDLLEYSGAEFIERIEIEAQKNKDFRQMLQGTWESGSPEVWQRFIAARGLSNDT
jgi:hypothetical protein